MHKQKLKILGAGFESPSPLTTPNTIVFAEYNKYKWLVQKHMHVATDNCGFRACEHTPFNVNFA